MLEWKDRIEKTTNNMFWEAVGIDANGDMLVKVFSKKKQIEFTEQFEKVEPVKEKLWTKALKRVDLITRAITKDTVSGKDRIFTTEGKEVMLKELEEQVELAYEDRSKFEELMELVGSDHVYVVPNRRVGKHERIEWNTAFSTKAKLNTESKYVKKVNVNEPCETIEVTKIAW